MKRKYILFLEINQSGFNIGVMSGISHEIVLLESFTLPVLKERTNLELNKQDIFKHFLLSLNKIEIKLKSRIEHCILIHSGMINLTNFKFKLDFGSTTKIKERDFDKLFKKAIEYFKGNLSEVEETVINEVIPIQYYRDSDKILKKSEGYGKTLMADFLFIHSTKSQINNAINIFHGIKLEIENFLFTPISFCLLKPDEQNFLYIDFDIYSTSYCIYDEAKKTFHYNSLKVGEFEVINDLRKILEINLQEANNLWNLVNDILFKEEDHIVNLIHNDKSISINAEKIILIVTARIKEILNLIKKDLSEREINAKEIYLSNKINGNLLFTELIKKIFKIKSKTEKLYPINLKESVLQRQNIDQFERILICYEFYRKFASSLDDNITNMNKLELGKISCFLKSIFY